MGTEMKRKRNLLKSSHCFPETPCIEYRLRQNRHSNCRPYQQKLQGGIGLGDGGWLHLGRWKRKVPVPGHCFRWWEGDPPVVDCRQSEANVAAEDYDCEPDFSCQYDGLFEIP